MHRRIEHPWTVASLASEAGMSRSAFAQRFKELMNESPLEYLTRWRMYRGSDLLRESDRKLADVAQAVGYDSDGAFHKAFKRVLGIPPGEYRRSVGAAQPSLYSPARDILKIEDAPLMPRRQQGRIRVSIAVFYGS